MAAGAPKAESQCSNEWVAHVMRDGQKSQMVSVSTFSNSRAKTHLINHYQFFPKIQLYVQAIS